MGKTKKYDFCGYATKANVRCFDGRTIRKDAFADQDGEVVPLVWNHKHDDPTNVLGHAILENRDDGMYAYCEFNNTQQGKNAKLIVEHGDVTALSIYANGLTQDSKRNVSHGIIREVSLVLAGANPMARIDDVLRHSMDPETEAVLFFEDSRGLELYHSDEGNDPKKDPEPKKDDSQKKADNNDADDDETVEDVINTMTEKQKKVMYAIVGIAAKDGASDEDDSDETKEGGNKSMKMNVFDNDERNARKDNYICHSDQEAILSLAKSSTCGTFQTALAAYCEENELQHDATSGGFEQPNNVTLLFPEYKDVRPGAPELITNDQGWISVVMKKVHKSPISRIRTGQVDIRNIDSLRAKGYKKGKQKGLAGNFKLVRRTTDPQTVYVKNALHRDDIVDITDFDYVQYLYGIDRMMLNEEIATAIMFGDGRDDGDDAKIYPEHIRPIWTDDDLYTLHVDLDIAAAKTELQGSGTNSYFGENYIYAEAMINTLLYAREKFKGSGTPDAYVTPHMLNVMLLARDRNGRRIYSSKAELASALDVGGIYTVEQMEGKTRTVETDDGNVTKKLICLVANLADYSLGATKGGEVSHFTQFDIDFNQEKSLLETRCSGALTRVYSAIAVEEEVTTTTTDPNG